MPFLGGLPYRMLNMTHNKELLWSLSFWGLGRPSGRVWGLGFRVAGLGFGV